MASVYSLFFVLFYQWGFLSGDQILAPCIVEPLDSQGSLLGYFKKKLIYLF